mgnify:CR=1 FL=1
MGVTYEIFYDEHVQGRDLPRIDTRWRTTISDAIFSKLTTNPTTYGKPLRFPLDGFRKLRVGDYRIVYKIKQKTVIVWAILHRSIIYREMPKRI